MTFPANIHFIQPPPPVSVTAAPTDVACQLWVAGPFVRFQDSRPEPIPVALTVVVAVPLVTQEVPAQTVLTTESRPVLRRATALPKAQSQNWKARRGLPYQLTAPARQPEATK